jgi:predicted lipoprotein
VGLLAVAGLFVVLALLWWAGLVATVQPINGTAAANADPASGASFDPQAYVAHIWTPQIVPAAQHGVALATLLPALARDPAAATAQYGNSAAGTSNFMVTLTGTVTKVDTSSPLGVVTVSVPTGATTVLVQVDVGPVILGTALRDALKFITFGEFLNQIQYGGVADALNAHVVQDVLPKLDVPKLQGQQISVDGAYVYNSADAHDVTVVPVVLQSKAGP